MFYIPCGKLKPFDKKICWLNKKDAKKTFHMERVEVMLVFNARKFPKKGHFGPNPQSFIA